LNNQQISTIVHFYRRLGLIAQPKPIHKVSYTRMKFSFNDFQFDCEQLILTRQGGVISLNEKPAQLLALFLCNADTIHNKSDILEKIWPDRVVTEQVVFQNISHLRALFGDDAISSGIMPMPKPCFTNSQ